MKKIYVGKSGIDGNGMFAGEDIELGARIAVIKGDAVKKKAKSPAESKIIGNWIGISNQRYMKTEGTPFRYIKHSCDSNAAITGTKTLVALRTIKKDEEITIDYSMTDADPHWGITCHCGTKKCRKSIRAIYTVPPEVFKRHMPFVSRYFQRAFLRTYVTKKSPKSGSSDLHAS